MESKNFIESLQNPPEDLQLVKAITYAIDEDDPEFLFDVFEKQTLVKPALMLQDMYVRSRKAEETELQKRWTRGILDYVHILDSRGETYNMSNTEVTLINAIRNYCLEQDLISQYKEKPDWMQDHYTTNLTQEEIRSFTKSPTGISVVGYAELALDTGTISLFKKAAENIEKAEPDDRQKLKSVLNTYVYVMAERLIMDVRFSEQADYPIISYNIVDMFASDELEIQRMKASLDKYIFRFAQDCLSKSDLQDDAEEYHQKAIDVISMFASSKTRAQALFEGLGLI